MGLSYCLTICWRGRGGEWGVGKGREGCMGEAYFGIELVDRI